MFSGIRRLLVVGYAMIGGVSLQTTNTPVCNHTPAPDYATKCNATNGFTLPNGRFIDQYTKFCDCTERVLSVQQQTCLGTLDLAFLECNPDGTFNCVVHWFGRPFCSNNRGGTTNLTYPDCGMQEAFCQSACIRYSQDANQFRNVGQCTCDLARRQQMDSTLSDMDKYVPQCNADGSWKNIQTGYGGSWCVNSTGDPTGAISFSTLYPPTCL